MRRWSRRRPPPPTPCASKPTAWCGWSAYSSSTRAARTRAMAMPTAASWPSRRRPDCRALGAVAIVRHDRWRKRRKLRYTLPIATNWRAPMRIKSVQRSLLTLAVLGALPCAQADTVLDHANGYTLNAAGKLLRFSSLAFDDAGKIIAVGSAKSVAAHAPHAQHVDLHGQTVLPGLIDAHGHVFELGSLASRVQLYETTSLADAVQTVAAFNVARPDGAWLIGFGWNQEIWKLGRFPTASELDAAVGNRPAWLHRVDGHAGWANSRAMQLAGITRDTPDPSGGKIERDADGNPSGVLVDAAMDMMDRVVPRPTEAESRAAPISAMSSLGTDGMTGDNDAGIDAGLAILAEDGQGAVERR